MHPDAENQSDQKHRLEAPPPPVIADRTPKGSTKMPLSRVFWRIRSISLESELDLLTNLQADTYIVHDKIDYCKVSKWKGHGLSMAFLSGTPTLPQQKTNVLFAFAISADRGEWATDRGRQASGCRMPSASSKRRFAIRS